MKKFKKPYLKIINYLDESKFGKMIQIKQAVDLGNGWYKPMHELDCEVWHEYAFNKFITSRLIKLDNLHIKLNINNIPIVF